MKCDECGKELYDEEIHTIFESRGEFWGAPCQEEIVTGYTCNDCGHTEEY